MDQTILTLLAPKRQILGEHKFKQLGSINIQNFSAFIPSKPGSGPFEPKVGCSSWFCQYNFFDK